jgi:hypothetical protein
VTVPGGGKDNREVPPGYSGKYPTRHRIGPPAMTAYAVIYEPAADGSWSARAADLPVYAVGDSREEAEREIRAAITVHLDELA